MTTTELAKETNETTLWTVKQVAKYFNICVSQVYHMAASGKLPSRKLSQKVLRFEESVVKNFGKEEVK